MKIKFHVSCVEWLPLLLTVLENLTGNWLFFSSLSKQILAANELCLFTWTGRMETCDREGQSHARPLGTVSPGGNQDWTLHSLQVWITLCGCGSAIGKDLFHSSLTCHSRKIWIKDRSGYQRWSSGTTMEPVPVQFTHLILSHSEHFDPESRRVGSQLEQKKVFHDLIYLKLVEMWTGLLDITQVSRLFEEPELMLSGLLPVFARGRGCELCIKGCLPHPK